ncbi:hypothetical protein DL764_003341 [Monosporascus ibericus]|uniref:Major facilitator superfamily (MFS) profile domain-containing protein n=1 Tax=Monosporascus ibericus TaxID=155417 RepID=A0A4V1XBG0_9PEZI|nr:hypothetical protein DL764_003341 [Monosporascus ibericus]
MAPSQVTVFHDVPGTIHLLHETGDPSMAGINYYSQSAWRISVFGIGIAACIQYSVLTQISEDTGIQVSELNLGTGLMFLFLGWGCLIWQPVTLVYERCGVYIASVVLSIIPMVWATYSSGSGTVAGLLYGTNLAWYNVLSATISPFLGAPPYNFSPKMIGVAYLSPFLFGAIGAVWSGRISDLIMIRLVRRNCGIREPEQRLWALSISGLLCSVGLVLWGVGASKGIHFMGLSFGFGFVALGIICAGSIALAYAVDCFKEIAGESMITIIIIRNIIRFAFNYAIDPRIDAISLQNCFISAALISILCTGSFLLMMILGKRWRRLSAKKHW